MNIRPYIANLFTRWLADVCIHLQCRKFDRIHFSLTNLNAMPMKRKITLFSMCCFVSLLSFAAQNIYISPAGDDDGDGTQVSPYAT